MTCVPQLRTVVEEIADTNAFLDDWRELQNRAEATPFLTLEWIALWIEHIRKKFQLKLYAVKVFDDRRCVGLAVVVIQRVRRAIVTHKTVATLHASGLPKADELTVEFNGLLAERNFEAASLAQFVDAVFEHRIGVEQLVLDGLEERLASVVEYPKGTHSACETTRPCYYVALNELRSNGNNYNEALDSRYRYQIRKAIKQYSALGAASLHVAANRAEALEFLTELERLHQSYWNSRGEPGSFANEFFRDFHRDLAVNCDYPGLVWLIRVQFGSQVIGYLYNFVCGGVMYNYQSGFDYRLLDGAGRPGYASHALAIDLALRHGLRSYEFMAGESEYKRRLSTHSRSMKWIVIRKNRWDFLFERNLRNLKRRIKLSLERRWGKPKN